MPNKIIFIAWNITKRSKVLANYLNAKIITCKIGANKIIRLFNFPFLIIITFLNLVVEKFDTVFVQLPPIQSAIPAYFYCKIFRKILIFDTHSGIFFPKGLHQKLYSKLYCSMIKNINLNIVHNDDILNRDCLKNTSSIVLEDKIYFSPSEYINGTQFSIAVISSYGKDEPIDEVIESAQALPDIQFYLTGNSNKLQVKSLPENLHLTSYLSEAEYEKLLRTVNIIMVLTTRPDTVLCGDYEAVGITKPLITSDTPTLRKYFNKGTVHTSNNALSIIQAIKTTQQKLDQLQSEIAELRKEKIASWQKQFEPIQQIINGK